MTERFSPQEIDLQMTIEFFKKISYFNEDNFLLNVSYHTVFFDLYSLNYRQPEVIFKRSGLDLTVFQKNLLTYANAVLNKLKNVSVPSALLKDPVKILEYEEGNYDLASRPKKIITFLRNGNDIGKHWFQTAPAP